MIRRDGSDMATHCFRSDHDLWREIQRAREAADAKHGENSIERVPVDFPGWLAILIEEVGEVAHALTYDAELSAALIDGLRAELIDVLSVASAWVEAIDAEERHARRTGS